MKKCILAMALGLFLNPVLSAEQQDSNPKVTYIVQHAAEQSNDYVEITLQIEAKDSSLTTAIQSAGATVDQIANLAKDYCNENAKKKADCKDSVEAGKFNVEPRYQTIRKEPVFMGFTVTHEMTLAVKAVQNIGYLVDNILTKPGITLKTFEWKPLEEPKTHEQALELGMQEGRGLCQKMGQKMGRIFNIQQLNEKDAAEEQEAEEGEEQEEEEEQEEQDEDKKVFKFQIECDGSSSKK